MANPTAPTILFEDNHCLVVNKPAGMLSQGDITGDPSLIDWVQTYWKDKYAKPGNVYVGLVHRLDRPTSGVVLLARTSKAAGRLAEQFRRGTVDKFYLAICEGTVAEESGIWEDSLLKDHTTNTVTIATKEHSGSQVAQVKFEVAFRLPRRVGIVLNPLTGRGHQLRVQLAARGLTIIGDFKYGSLTKLLANDERPRIALHAARLKFKHPTKAEICEVQAGVPSDWPGAADAFGTGWIHSSKPAGHPDR